MTLAISNFGGVDWKALKAGAKDREFVDLAQGSLLTQMATQLNRGDAI